VTAWAGLTRYVQFAMSNLHRYFEIKTKRKLNIYGNETVTKNKETTIMIKKEGTIRFK